jgi:hypothetical protein
MLNNISTDSVHRKNIWTDSLNNIFYNGCISDEEMKVYCFGDGGGGGGSGDGGVAGDFGAAEAGLGAIGETSGTGGKSGTQSDDTGISDAITDAMSGTLGGTMSDDAAFGPAFGPSVVDADVPDSTESFYSTEDIEAAFPSSFSIIGSPLSILGSALLSAIPVIGPVLGVASTVMGAIGTIGDVTGIAGLSTIGDFSPTSLASKGLSSLATTMGVPSNVTSALSSPVLSVEVGNQQTGLTSGLVGGLVDVIDPQAQTQFGIDVPIGKSAFAGMQDTFSNIPASIEQGLSSIGLQGDTSYSSFDDPEGSDNPIAVTAAKATGGLISLRDNGGPVVSDAQKAYMNWLASVGGPSALSKRGLQKGRIDEVITPAGPEYFSYDQGDVRGAGLYDDFALDYSDFAFAYPENPAFRSLNALGGGPRNIPQSVAPQNIVDVTRQAVIARRLSDEEEERLRRLRRGLPVNVVNAVGAYTGGGIQQLVNQGPTLLDVVNKGISIPEETIPSQRPQPFIKGQQPGGLRSTNYYTNAMQPASFYAQPQQVRNYGSIY